MISRRLARPFFVFSATIVTNSTAEDDCVCKPSDLPVYTNEPPISATDDKCVCTKVEHSTLEVGVGTVRQTVFKVVDEVNRVTARAQDFLLTGINHTEDLVTYLREEENVTPKYGAIAIGGFSGFILALRGRFFRKLIYTSTGALAMAALCYPKHATRYTNMAYDYCTIAMNFAYGVKKDDPALQLPSLPKFPDSVNDVWDKIKSFSFTESAAPPAEPHKVKEIDPLRVIQDAHDDAASFSCEYPEIECVPTGPHNACFPEIPKKNQSKDGVAK